MLADWDPLDPECPARQLLDRIGDKWTLLIISSLEGRRPRFSELLSLVHGISPKVLTSALRGLERDGIVSRHAYPEIPPRVEYALTDVGRGLAAPIEVIRTWAETHMAEVIAAREDYDARAVTGRRGGGAREARSAGSTRPR